MITIVSGLPRCGTSLMMQMLVAGGLAALTDGERQADADNPRGYYEWEPIKNLPAQPTVIAQAEDKVVKCISQLLLALPAGHEYRVIFMSRPLAEVIDSQAEMIRRRGTTGAKVDEAGLARAFEAHLKQVDRWLAGRPDVKILRIPYHDVLRDPSSQSHAIQQFLGSALDIDSMTQCVQPELYRQRRTS